MKYVINILNWIKGNKLLSLLILVIGLAATIILLREKAKVKCEDCKPYKDDVAFYKEQTKILTEGLLDIKKEMQPAQPTSFIGSESYYMFASYDTVPKRKTQYQIQQRVINKIDSLLYRVRQDSAKRTQQKTKT